LGFPGGPNEQTQLVRRLNSNAHSDRNRCDGIDSTGLYAFVNKIDAMASIHEGNNLSREKSMRSHRLCRVAYPSVGVAAISASVYAWRGEVKTLSVAPSSTMRPCRMT
jgi:hypothetical protein